jgi:succinoglycan biosynthesis protein ExoA
VAVKLTKPTVSITIPCLNEVKTIRALLDALLIQTYPMKLMEIIIADGFSTDGTRDEIGKFQKLHPELKCKIVDNSRKIIPSGLNIAIRNSTGEIIIRLDAHSTPNSQYIEKSVKDLLDGKGDNVGGVWQICPGNETWIARSIAVAASHPVGVGDAMYRHSDKAASVDTVPFGAFRRQLVSKVGEFDETLITNEDYEFNTRIRKQGGIIWLDPEIRSDYTARPDLPALRKQYYRYGFWKWQMLRRYPETIRWRQLLPPLFVFSLICLFFGAFFYAYFFLALILEILAYGLILMGVIFPRAIREKAGWLLVGFPLSVATMHLSWGTGFLLSILTFRKREILT